MNTYLSILTPGLSSIELNNIRMDELSHGLKLVPDLFVEVSSFAPVRAIIKYLGGRVLAGIIHKLDLQHIGRQVGI